MKYSHFCCTNCPKARPVDCVAGDLLLPVLAADVTDDVDDDSNVILLVICIEN